MSEHGHSSQGAPNQGGMDRRSFLQASAAAATAATGSAARGASDSKPGQGESRRVVDDFNRPDSYHAGHGWESLNPGYWAIRGGALRRRLEHRGDAPSGHWFPWHWETHRGKPIPTAWDPSLPVGFLFRRDWKLSGGYAVRIRGTIRGTPPRDAEPGDWKQHQPGYGLLGIAFGSRCLHEGLQGKGKPGNACWYAAWHDDGTLGVFDHSGRDRRAREDAATESRPPQGGDRFTLDLTVEANGDAEKANVTVELSVNDSAAGTVTLDNVDPAKFTNGYFGLAARGLLDFEVDRVELAPKENEPLNAPVNELHACYALGDTLQQDGDGNWRCTFVAICRGDGDEIELRIADAPEPDGGWDGVSVAGSGKIVSNGFRRHTAVIEATLPRNPAEATLYYTVRKDGRDVTADPRIGTDAVGDGTGFVGRTPGSGAYVGRLPRLKAPYKVCGNSCHAIWRNSQNHPDAGPFGAWWINDQPTPDAWRHLDQYGFQVMLWEDDVWYMERVHTPPSVDDAYKIITTAIAGPTTRWQMMRHWNVINPGDHDHGMDDVKGPEQIAIRRREGLGLGQDPDYLRRNFQIVSHLIRGEESPSPTANPKRWRRWKMPDRDFSMLIVDGRMWRSSQDTSIWGDWGWESSNTVYRRQDPTRALLGEEQFAWLERMIRTDSSPLICVTGMNGLHTVWSGVKESEETGEQFAQRDRVAADYAGWVSAGVDRVLELLGGRSGVVSVYGDVHVGGILRNPQHRLYECCFGPIGRHGGRRPKEGFGPTMTDYDGRSVEVHAFYHHQYESPKLDERTGPRYWNFLEMRFDPRQADPTIGLRVRNLIDPPDRDPRGGGFIEDRASNTGRPATARLPEVTTLPNADVTVTTTDGEPLRATRTDGEGRLRLPGGLPDVDPGTPLLITAHADGEADAKVVTPTQV